MFPEQIGTSGPIGLRPTAAQIGITPYFYWATDAITVSGGQTLYEVVREGGVLVWKTIAGNGFIPGYESGLLGDDVPAAPNVAIGARPLAQSRPLGSIWTALDMGGSWQCGVHPTDPTKKIWRPIGPGVRVNHCLNNAVTAATSGRLGVWVKGGTPTTGVFTQCAVAGQYCNAIAASSAIAGAAMLVVLIPTTTTTIRAAANLVQGGEVMAAADGNYTPYVVAAGNVALGISNSSVEITDTVSALLYDW